MKKCINILKAAACIAVVLGTIATTIIACVAQ